MQRIVRADGTVVNQYDYDAFGNIRWENSFEGVPNRYTFQGREWDAHAGHYHYRNRTYIPEWGSFTGPDMNLERGILGEHNGMGGYLFCENNPLVWVDPLGLSALSWLFGHGYSGPEARAFDGGFIEGLKKSKVNKWVYTGDPNASAEMVDAGVASVASDLYQGIEYDVQVGFKEGHTGPRIGFNEHLRIWNPDTGGIDFSWGFAAEGDLCAYRDSQTDVSVGGFTLGVDIKARPCTSQYSFGGKSEVHWTEAAVKGQTQVLGRDVAHQYKARVFGAEANSEFVLDLQNLRGGFDVGAGAYVVKHQETIDILLSQSRALRAQGEIGLGSVAWKRALMVRAGLPPIEKAGRTDTIPTPVPITVGGKIGLIDPNEFGNF